MGQTNDKQLIIGCISMFHIIIAELFRKQLSLMLLLGKRHSFSAQENANHSDCFFSITWHLNNLIDLN